MVVQSKNKKLGFVPENLGDITKTDFITMYVKVVSPIELGEMYDEYLKPLQKKKSVKKKEIERPSTDSGGTE